MKPSLFIRSDFVIPAEELSHRAIRASGPGGQHVNRSSTGVRLTWNPYESVAIATLSERDRAWLLQRLQRRLNRGGGLSIDVDTRRSQKQNLEEAHRRLEEVLRGALARPRDRIATQVSRAEKRRRLQRKKARGEIKKLRQRPSRED